MLENEYSQIGGHVRHGPCRNVRHEDAEGWCPECGEEWDAASRLAFARADLVATEAALKAVMATEPRQIVLVVLARQDRNAARAALLKLGEAWRCGPPRKGDSR